MALHDDASSEPARIPRWAKAKASFERFISERSLSPQTHDEKSRPLQTMVFADEEELARFLNHVFEQYDGRGFEFTNVPIPATIRIRPWLLEQTRDQFCMSPSTEEHLRSAQQSLASQQPFDPKNLEDLQLPQTFLAEQSIKQRA